jgi:hypothetical protein
MAETTKPPDVTTDFDFFLLTTDDLTTVRLALRRCADELEAQMEGEGTYSRVVASAWFACAHIRAQIAPLLERIEKKLKELHR